MIPHLERRPIVVALAGPNGAGKSTFYDTQLASTRLRFVNTDVVAREFGIDAYEASEMTDVLRRELVSQRESFVFETVFSDPVGDKLSFLKQLAVSGYTVVLVFIGLSSPRASEERVSIRVREGGHDVPADKLRSRYPRTMANLKAAIRELPHVAVLDNDDMRSPFRRVAEFESGRVTFRTKALPRWLKPLM